MKKTSLLFCVLMALAGVNGCASTADEETPLTAEEQYNQAYKEMEETSYKTAAKSFEKVELEHPYSKWAVKAKIMGAYSFYKAKEYEDAIMSLD